MIAGYVAFFVLGVIVYFMALKLALPWRVLIALAVFIVPSIVLTIWFVSVGDKSPPDAVTVVPKPDTKTDKPRETGTK